MPGRTVRVPHVNSEGGGGACFSLHYAEEYRRPSRVPDLPFQRHFKRALPDMTSYSSLSAAESATRLLCKQSDYVVVFRCRHCLKRILARLVAGGSAEYLPAPESCTICFGASSLRVFLPLRLRR